MKSHSLLRVLLLASATTFGVAPAFAQPTTTVPEIQRSYVPVDELEAILARRERGVLMTAAEFEELLKAARENAAAAPRTPADLVLGEAKYATRIDGDRLRIDGTLAFRQLRDGWTAVPLRLEGLAIESATIGDDPARIGRSDSGVRFLHEAAGTGTLTLGLSAPVAEVGSDLVTSFRLPSPGTATLSIDVPAGKRLLVGDAALPRPEAIDQPTTYRIPVGGEEPIRLTITDRETNRSTDALLFAQSAVGLDVAPGEVGWRAVVSLNAFGQRLDSLSFEVPAELEIAGVDSTGLESWTLDDLDAADPAKGTVVTLNYRRAFEGTRQVVLQGVLTATEGEAWSVPPLVVRGATSHVGRIVLDVPRDVRLERTVADGVRAIAEPPEVANTQPTEDGRTRTPSRRLAFDYWREDFTLDLVTHVKSESYLADQNTAVVVYDDRLELLMLVTVTGRFGTTFDVTCQLPAAWEVTGITADETEVAWDDLPNEAGIRTIRVPLPNPVPRGGTASLVLQARLVPEIWPPSVAPVELPLPEVRLDASSVEATYVVRYPDWFDVTPIDTRGLDPQPANDESGDELRRLAFSYQNGRISGTLRIAPRPSHAAVRTLAFARLDEDALRTFLEMEVTLSGSGRRDWVVSLPETLGDRLRFDIVSGGAGIVEQSSGPPQGGRISWTLRFDGRVRGTIVLAVNGETPADGPLDVPLPDFPAAERHHGYVAVEANGRQRMSMTGIGPNDEPLWEVDPIELPDPVAYTPRERVVGVLRFVLPRSRVRLEERRFDRVPVPTAICRSMSLETAIGRKGFAQHRMSAEVTTSGVQIVGLDLPVGSEIWSTTVDGAAVELRYEHGAHAVQWPTEDTSGSTRRLEVHYATPIESVGGRFRQRAPGLALYAEGRWSAVEVLGRDWTVHHPSGTALVSSDGAFEPTSPLAPASILGSIRRTLGSVRPIRAANRTGVVVVVLAVLFLVTLGARHWGAVLPVVPVVVIVLCTLAFILLMMAFAGRQDTAARYTSSEKKSDDAKFAQQAETYNMDMGGEEFDDFSDPFGGDAKSDDATKSEMPTPKPDPAPVIVPEPNSPIAPPALDMPVDPAAPGEDLAEELRRARIIETRNELEEQREIQRHERLAKLEGETARLSVPIEFEEPIGGRSQRFTYGGTRTAELSVGLASVEKSWAWRCFVAILVAAVFWLMRRGSGVARSMFAVLVLAVAVGGLGLVPAEWQPTCDGLLLGTIAGVLLWGVAGICGWFARAKPYSIPRSSTLALLAALTLGSNTFAEEPQPAMPLPPPAAEAPDWTVIVPYANEADPLAGDRVFVPRATFARLWNLAHPDDPVEARDLPDAIVSAAEYATTLEPGGDGAPPRIAVTATFTVHTFAAGSRVEVPVGGVATRSLELDGKPAAIVPNDRGLTVTVPDAGRHTVVVGYARPARVTGPAGRFTLDVADVPAGRIVFPLPANDLRVRVDGAANTFRLNRDGEAATVVVPVAKGGPTTIEWRPESEREDGDANVLVETTTLVDVSDLGVVTTSAFRCESRGAGVNELSFDVPADVRVRRIAGEDVGGWSFDGEGEGRTLAVFLRRTVDDATTIVIEVFRPSVGGDVMEGTVPLPTVAPHGVARETGRVAIHADPHLDVQPTNVAGLRRIESFGEVAATLDVPAMPRRFAFRYPARPIEATLAIARRRASLRVEARHTARVGRYDVTYDSRFLFEVGDTPRQRLAVRLPADYVPLDVLAAGLDDWYTRDEADGRVLVVEFTDPCAGRVEVVLKGETTRAYEEGDPEPTVTIDVPVPLDAERTTSAIGLFAADGLRVRVDGLGDWERIALDRVHAEIQSRGTRTASAALSTEVERPEAITALVQPEVPNWAGGDTLHLVTVDDARVSSILLMQWRYDAASASEFSFTLPEEYAERLEIREPLRRIEETPIDGGRVRWTLHAERPVAGSFLVSASVESPPPQQRVTAPVPILERPVPAAEGGAFTALDVQNRYVVAVNESRRQLTLDEDDDLDPVAVRDIGFLADERYEKLFARATTLARLRTLDVLPTWETATYERTRGAAAAVRLADLVTVVGTEGTWRGRAIYTIENRNRQFLALVFPEGVRPLGATVRGKARPIVAGDDGRILIPIPLSERTGNSPGFEVAVVYAGDSSLGKLRGPLGLTERILEPPAPRVVSPTEDADLGIPVTRTRWTVYLPDGYTARPADDDRNTFVVERDERAERVDSSEKLPPSEGPFGDQSWKFTGRTDERVNDEQKALQKELFERNVGMSGPDPTDDGKDSGFRLEDRGGRVPNQPSGRPGIGRPGDEQPGEGQPGEGQPGNIDGGRRAVPGRFDRDERRERTNEQQQRLDRLIDDLNEVQRNQKDTRADTERERAEGNRPATSLDGSELPSQSPFDRRTGGGGAAEEDTEFGYKPGSGLGSLEGYVDEALATPTGTLSLDIDLPVSERGYVFTKTGGDPRLAIAVLPDDAVGTGFGLGWALLWIALVIAVFRIADQSARSLRWFLPAAATVLGAIGFVVFDDAASLGAFVVFLVGAIATCIVLGRRRSESA